MKTNLITGLLLAGIVTLGLMTCAPPAWALEEMPVFTDNPHTTSTNAASTNQTYASVLPGGYNTYKLNVSSFGLATNDAPITATFRWVRALNKSKTLWETTPVESTTVPIYAGSVSNGVIALTASNYAGVPWFRCASVALSHLGTNAVVWSNATVTAER